MSEALEPRRKWGLKCQEWLEEFWVLIIWRCDGVIKSVLLILWPNWTPRKMGKIFFKRTFYIQTSRALVFPTVALSQLFYFEPFWPGLTSSRDDDADCSPAYLNLTIAPGALKLVVLLFCFFNFIFNSNLSFFSLFNLLHMPRWSCICCSCYNSIRWAWSWIWWYLQGMWVSMEGGYYSTFGLALNLNSCSWCCPENTQLTLLVSFQIRVADWGVAKTLLWN